MKIFNTIADLESASLKAGQLVRVKGVGLFSVESSGAGYTLANGNKAVVEALNQTTPTSGVTITEEQTATAGQTLFTLSTTYQTSGGNIVVYINGVRQLTSTFTETSSTEVTFSTPAVVDDAYTFVVRGNQTTPTSGVTITEEQTATAGQTLFTLSTTYQTSGGNIVVYINGVRQLTSTFTETSSTEVTFSTPAVVDDQYTFVVRGN